MPNEKAIHFPFTFGGDPEAFCAECQLPCNLERMNIDCHRRFFLQGLLHCSYFVYGRCFLIDVPGCVFDNGGRHDKYWLQLLNDYFHNVSRREEDEEFLARREEVLGLVKDQIERQNVYFCRYLEEYYNQIMQTGGGLSEEMLDELDEAYLDLLRGISRKTD
ncbi:MAG TPA: hypothetical protein ENO08_07470 [Candidatus Eisenbacteria bacterium]|uniref:Uncharacterized protein n=1 Tax=Eiseniibacteriota bacterium TaxID=2212470 RepID=A0A7V2F514_UNCEI|nr:hypothetical protein [Candidatus Eisenbacteria bacterium]